jgi:Domain of unknown function (DUF2382)
LEPSVISDRSTDIEPQQSPPIQPQTVDAAKVLTSEVFYLLEERLMVDLTRRKTGEIVVRKEVDTEILHVEVPVRREKLIVEQVSPEYKLLAQIDLGGEYVGNGMPASIDRDDAILARQNQNNRSTNGNIDRDLHTLGGTFTSLQAAIDLLTEFSLVAGNDVGVVKVEIALTNNGNRERYQKLLVPDL